MKKCSALLACFGVLSVLVPATMARDIYVQPGGSNGGGNDYTSAYTTIQAAVNAAVAGDVVLVYPGTYAPFATANKAITIRGVNGPEQTIVDGGGTARPASLGTTTGETATVVSGLTLRNGSAAEGGGALYGTLTNCWIYGNAVTMNGGGVFGSVVINSKIYNNTASQSGGGAVGAALIGCLVYNNTAGSGAAGIGGGVMSCSLNNCTVYDNTAGIGGGVFSAAIANSIIWGNTSASGSDNYASFDMQSTFSYSCSTPTPAGAGNVNAAPRFWHQEILDFRLGSNSPCAYSGNPAAVLAATDMNGFSVVVNGKASMGALAEVMPYAVWFVTFDARGGTPASRMLTQRELNYYVVPSDPARTAYTFDGWFKTVGGTDKVTAQSVVMPGSGDHTLYAGWTPIQYQISYTLNGGVNSTANPTNYTIESPDINLANATRAGFSFLGWFTDAALTTAASTPAIPTGSMGVRSFYASWATNLADRVTIDVKYYFDSVYDSSRDAQVSVWAGGVTAGDIPTSFPGYTLTGFFPALASYDPNSGVPLNVYLTANPFDTVAINVNYYFDGVYDATEDTNIVVWAGMTYASNIPTVFAGYMLDPAAPFAPVLPSRMTNQQVLAVRLVTDLNLTVDIDVEYYFDGVHNSAYDTNLTVWAGQVYPSNIPTGFPGYDVDPVTPFVPALPAMLTNGQLVTVYMVTNGNVYTVTFDANGGYPTPATQTLLHNSLVAEPSPMPSNGEDELMGWHVGDTNGPVWNFQTDRVKTNLTLVAKWGLLKLNPTNIALGLEGTLGTAIQVTAKEPWFVVTNSPWFNIRTTTNPDFIIITVSSNLTATAFEGMVVVGTTDGLLATCTVTQAARGWMLEVEPTPYPVAWDGGDETADVLASGDWWAISSNDWITLTGATNGTYDAPLAFHVATNPLPTRRVGYVVVTDGTVNRILAVDQEPGIEYLSVSPASQRVVAGGESGLTIDVTANVPWYVQSIPSWISFTSPSGGYLDSQTTFNVASNTSAESRTGVLVYAQSGGSLTATSIVIQATFGRQLEGIPSQIVNIPYTGTSGIILVEATVDWTAIPEDGWLHVTEGSSGSLNGSFRYSVDINTNSTGRMGYIKLDGGGLERNILFVQDAGPAALNVTPALIAAPGAGMTTTLNITGNTDWLAIPSVTWLRVGMPPMGSGDGFLQLTVDQSLVVGMARTGSVTFTSSQGVSATVTVIQEEGIAAALSLNPTRVVVGYNGAANQAIDVTANVDWTASANVSWITVHTTSGTGTASLVYSVTGTNTGNASRSGTITVLWRGVSSTITIVQRPELYFTAIDVQADGSVKLTWNDVVDPISVYWTRDLVYCNCWTLLQHNVTTGSYIVSPSDIHPLGAFFQLRFTD